MSEAGATDTVSDSKSLRRTFMNIREFGKNPMYVEGGQEPQYITGSLLAETEPKQYGSKDNLHWNHFLTLKDSRYPELTCVNFSARGKITIACEDGTSQDQTKSWVCQFTPLPEDRLAIDRVIHEAKQIIETNTDFYGQRYTSNNLWNYSFRIVEQTQYDSGTKFMARDPSDQVIKDIRGIKDDCGSQVFGPSFRELKGDSFEVNIIWHTKCLHSTNKGTVKDVTLVNDVLQVFILSKLA